MDNSMPVMNGVDATKRIRELGYTGKIFGVTGNGFQSDIDEFIAHGADEVLVKPVSAQGYAHVIACLICSHNEHAAGS
jgi:CheY-like chemotaxis protein